MFAMIHIPTGLIIGVLAVLIAIPLVVNLAGAALGALGAGSRGLRWKAIGCGFGVGVVVTLIAGWLLMNLGAVALSAPLFGAGLAFAVARGVVKTEVVEDARP